MKLESSLPFFKALLKSSHARRSIVLKSFPRHVVDDLVEILYNVVIGNYKISSSRRKIFNRYKSPLLSLKNSKSRNGRRRIIFKQSGGFLSALIPIVTSIAGALVGSLTG